MEEFYQVGFFLVEVAGFEPASGDAAQVASTGLARALNSRFRVSPRAGALKPALLHLGNLPEGEEGHPARLSVALPGADGRSSGGRRCVN
jgi:hypothetical protein